MKLLQINVNANVGSHGKIAEQIGRLAQDRGWESYIAYSRYEKESHNNLIRIGSDLDIRIHGLQSRLFDNHGLASLRATRNLIEKIKIINPYIIHLHNIHGYFLNFPILFKFLKEWGGPVVWTLHDCWPFTGHCAFFMANGCEKWKTGCHNCEALKSYPASWILDGSKRNYRMKEKYFTSLGDRLSLVSVSNYVKDYLEESIFRNTKMQVIHNGIDINTFKPSSKKDKIVLGVANKWEDRKGLPDFFKLRNVLPSSYQIILIGLSDKQIKDLPNGIIGLKRTNGQKELSKMYSSAIALVNPTYEDNYPTVNLESIACGTPVITYKTGGSPESITSDTGIVLEKGDIQGIVEGIYKAETGAFPVEACRRHAEKSFDQRHCFQSYFDLYTSLMR